VCRPLTFDLYLGHLSDLLKYIVYCIVVDLTGSLPDGVYNRNTRIYFCCRADGPASLAILLPTAVPFYLLKYGEHCQKVCSG